MAIDMTNSGAGAKLPGSCEGKHFVLRKEIDFAAVLAAKGSALAAGDIIQCLDIPAKHVVIAANVHPTVAADADTLTGDLGFTASPEADYDNFVDGLDLTQIATDGVPIFSVQGYTTAATTIDLELQTLTGTLTSGKCVVVAVVIDMS